MTRVLIPLEKDSPDFEKVIQGFLEQEIEVYFYLDLLTIYIPIDWVESEDEIFKGFKIKRKNYNALKDVANYLVKEGYRVSYQKEEKFNTNFKDNYMVVRVENGIEVNLKAGRKDYSRYFSQIVERI